MTPATPCSKCYAAVPHPLPDVTGWTCDRPGFGGGLCGGLPVFDSVQTRLAELEAKQAVCAHDWRSISAWGGQECAKCGCWRPGPRELNESGYLGPIGGKG